MATPISELVRAVRPFASRARHGGPTLPPELLEQAAEGIDECTDALSLLEGGIWCIDEDPARREQLFGLYTCARRRDLGDFPVLQQAADRFRVRLVEVMVAGDLTSRFTPRHLRAEIEAARTA